MSSLKKPRRIVTSGRPYLDIDAYAGIIAYAELLRAQGHDAVAASTSVLNESITQTIRSWHAPLVTNYEPLPGDTFTVIDTSDPDHFDPIVDLAQVTEVIDHHPGLEQYWRDRIGAGTDIEFIGAACTQVFERWQKAGLLAKMTQTSAKLLLSGILDNTLNFKAMVTTDRDHQAYTSLSDHAHTQNDYPSQYFTECQEAILADARTSITNDVKTLQFKTYPAKLGVGQLVIWDASDVAKSHLQIIESVMSKINPKWFMNLVSVGEGNSYFIATDPSVQQWLSNLLDVRFTDRAAKSSRLWLRKEIIKQDLDTTPK